jgi:uncharacterized membrane protein YeaQ/YmgE (transglycosylase-associated protein family)
MSLIWTILVGFVAGLLARMLKPGRDDMGMIMTTLLGIGGAFAVTALGRSMGWYGPDDAAGFIGAFVGAFLILLVIGAVRSRGTRDNGV